MYSDESISLVGGGGGLDAADANSFRIDDGFFVSDEDEDDADDEGDEDDDGFM